MRFSVSRRATVFPQGDARAPKGVPAPWARLTRRGRNAVSTRRAGGTSVSRGIPHKGRDEHEGAPVNRADSGFRLAWVVMFGAPLLWAILTLVHPSGEGDIYAELQDQVGRWLFVHVAQVVLAPFLAPFDPLRGNLSESFLPPSPQHWMGTNIQGQDVLSRIIWGARLTLGIAVLSVTFGVIVGGFLGAVAGFFKGWVDGVIMRTVDVMLAIPGLLLAIGIVTFLGRGVVQVAMAIAIVNVPIFARLLRSSLLGLRTARLGPFPLPVRLATRVTLGVVHLALGRMGPSEQAARARLRRLGYPGTQKGPGPKDRGQPRRMGDLNPRGR